MWSSPEGHKAGRTEEVDDDAATLAGRGSPTFTVARHAGARGGGTDRRLAGRRHQRKRVPAGRRGIFPAAGQPAGERLLLRRPGRLDAGWPRRRCPWLSPIVLAWSLKMLW